MKSLQAIVVTGALLGLLTACSSSASSGPTATSAVRGTTTAAPTTVSSSDVPSSGAPTSTTAADSTTPGVSSGWDILTAPRNCMCFDGAPFTYFVHTADTSRVVFFLEGGGACFSAATCKPDSTTFKRTIDPNATIAGLTKGVWDRSNPANPFRDWSVVYVPYCTGDAHLGNTRHDYGNGVVVEHKGYVNAATALQKMAELFPSAANVVVAGESAGSVPTPLFAGMTHDLLPKAQIEVLADGSGAYPDLPAINSVIGGAWGTINAVPAWPENKGITVAKWSPPGLFIQAGKHDPQIVFARHDYAFDATQASYARLAGIDAKDLLALIDGNEREVEAAGVQLASFISPGDHHTVLGTPDFYTETVNGLKFVDWVTALVDGKPVGDDHCTKCSIG